LTYCCCISPSRPTFDKTVDAYRALEKLHADGRVRAIGVSNFMPDVLAALLDRSSVVPSVNQVELHPYFTEPDVQRANAKHGVLTQAWSPMGGITSYRGGGRSTFDDPVIAQIAVEHARSPAQVMLRWHLQEGRSAIPKSVNPERIAANFDVFDFELTAGQIAAIDGLNTGVRGGPDPESVTPEAFDLDIPEA
jgi:diketogulonate reductase-like aldo/keto reductase